MKIHRLTPFSICCAVFFALASQPSTHAYDVPAFEASPFAPDGIFLEDGDKQSLLEALASVASNFQANESIDDDVTEKALAIALTIDPFHGNSRQAHEALARGERPSTTSYFDSRSAAAEALWGIANRLNTPPVEPEAKNLVPLLMELSLLTHPSPGTDRVIEFDRIAKGHNSLWSGFVSLQPDLHASNRRVQNFKREAKTAKTKQEIESSGSEIFDTKGSQPEKGANELESPDMILEAPEIVEERRSISGVFALPSGGPAGAIKLHIRAPLSTEEASQFDFLDTRPAETYPELPLIFAGDAQHPISSGPFLGQKVKEHKIIWQQGAIGEVTFESAEGTSGDEQSKIHSSLPLLISLKSISDSRPLNSSFAVAGAYTRQNEKFVEVKNTVKMIQASEPLAQPYLLIQNSTFSALIEHLTETQELELLFYSNLLGFDTFGEVYEMVTMAEVTPALKEASQIFAEIESVSERMSLPELARNIKVQERLEGILELVPNHYSARAMLEFGRASEPTLPLLEKSIDEIDSIIGPYFALRREFRADTNILKHTLEEADLALAGIRTTIPPEAQDYFTLAGDMLEAAEIYLGFSNKTTSIAEQRLRELKEIFDSLDSIHAEFGLPPRSDFDREKGKGKGKGKR
ncbi:MAG: hypothetical protein AAF357_04215 [Verrucomicrobiota bacterium]